MSTQAGSLVITVGGPALAVIAATGPGVATATLIAATGGAAAVVLVGLGLYTWLRK